MMKRFRIYMIHHRNRLAKCQSNKKCIEKKEKIMFKIMNFFTVKDCVQNKRRNINLFEKSERTSCDSFKYIVDKYRILLEII